MKGDLLLSKITEVFLRNRLYTANAAFSDSLDDSSGRLCVRSAEADLRFLAAQNDVHDLIRAYLNHKRLP